MAAHLKTRLLRGEWKERLPGERLLAKELGVGRMTLRSALELLEEEELIVKEGLSGTRPTRTARRRSEGPRKVGILMGGAPEILPNNTAFMVDELRRLLYAKNITLHLHHAAPTAKRGVVPLFRHLVQTLHYDAWILCGGTLEMHQWCEAHRLPVVLASALFDGVHLSSVEIDFRAVCRHAVGEMARRGHREVALILSNTPANSGPGDIQSRLGFLEAVEALRPSGMQGSVETHSGKNASICRLVDQLLARTPRPTAWLVPTPYFLTVMVHLMGKGIRIPGDISLICRDAEAYHSNLVPEPTRYLSDLRHKARQLVILIQRLLENRHSPVETRHVMPEFQSGSTLGPKT